MNEITIPKLFSLGRILITSGAHDFLERADVAEAMGRHAHGDWGDIPAADVEQNTIALREGGRLVSVYHDRKDTKFFIITEADRSVTTVMLDADY